MTPAGWYPDPERPGVLRWWDGVQWTDARHDPMRSGTLQPIGKLVNQVFSDAWDRRLPVMALAAFGYLLPSLPLVVAIRHLVNGVVVADIDADSADVTGFDPDRLWWVLLAFAAAGLCAAVTSFAVAHQFSMLRLGTRPTMGESLSAGVRGFVRMFGWVVLGLAAMAAGGGLALALIIASPLFLLLVIPSFGVLFVWLYVKLGFVFISAVTAPPGTNVLKASAAVSRGRFWPVAWRLLLVWLIGAAVPGVVFNTIGQLSGAAIDTEALNIEVSDDGGFTTNGPVDLEEAFGTFLVVSLIFGAIQNAVTLALTSAGQASIYHQVRAPAGLE